MDENARQVARATAKVLEGSGERDLRLRVEEVLLAEDADHLALDIALASLIVSIASLTWTIAQNLYDDIQKRSKERHDEEREKLRENIVRTVREELAQSSVSADPRLTYVETAVVDAVIARLRGRT